MVVLGGGDTGADCIGTAHRHGAKSVTTLAIGKELPRERPEHELAHGPTGLRGLQRP